MMAAIPISEWTYFPFDGSQLPRIMMGGDRAIAPDKPNAGYGRRAVPPAGIPNTQVGQQPPATPGDAPLAGDTTTPSPGVEIGGVTLAPATPQYTSPPIREKHQNRNATDLPSNNNAVFGYGAPPAPVPIWRPPVTSEGFAIPINDIKLVLDDLRAGITRERVWIGLRTNDEINTVIEDNLIKMTPFVHIRDVVPESPAARSGIVSGDILVSIDERPIKHEADVHAVMLRLRPGQTVPVVVKRADGLRTFTLKIETRPNHIEQTDTRPEKVLPKPTPMASGPH
jgi:membrane-associated protease RseP (regulator of RpoE activity)